MYCVPQRLARSSLTRSRTSSVRRHWLICRWVRNCVGQIWARNLSPQRVPKVHKGFESFPSWLNLFMRIIYFSKNYTPHDYRFLSSLSKTEHEIYYLKLEETQRQIEDRPVPENVQQILWAGGKHEFRWRDVLRLTFDL